MSENGIERKAKVCAECYANLRDSDEPLAKALRHYVEEHPESETLERVLQNIWIKTECSGCGVEFIADVDHDLHIGLQTRQYCGGCESDNALRRLCMQTLTPEKVVSYEVDRENWHEPKAYTLTGSDVTPEWREVHVRCPDCNRATDVDLPRGNCKHCGVELSVVVRTYGWHEADCSLHTGGDQDV